jgi:hypothetical protein
MFGGVRGTRGVKRNADASLEEGYVGGQHVFVAVLRLRYRSHVPHRS